MAFTWRITEGFHAISASRRCLCLRLCCLLSVSRFARRADGCPQARMLRAGILRTYSRVHLSVAGNMRKRPLIGEWSLHSGTRPVTG
jgi:hypothetical protein